MECLRYMYRMLFVLFIESRPELGYAPIKAQSYFGRLSFETSPQWPTEHREETKIAERVRILQCRTISKDDVAELVDFSDPTQTPQTYKISRAYHGIDDESGEMISDLSLEVMKT